MKRILKTLFLLFLMAFVTENSFAQITWTVDVNGSGDFTCIQDAISAANQGDTVSVAAGIYSPSSNGEIFPIIMKDGVKLEGAGPDVCTLDAESTGSVIFCNGITNGMTEIKGFSITNGFDYYGGGIYCKDSSLMITGNFIYENKASGGGGIFSLNSYLAIENNIIINNETKIGYFTGSGGGIYLHNYSNVVMANCLIAFNDAEDDGGGIAFNRAQSKIINCTIYGNSSGSHGYGGGACIGASSEAEIANSILWANSALGGGQQIIIGGQSKLSIEYSNVEGGELAVPVSTSGTLMWGIGMLDLNPQFNDPGIGDCHLNSGSPCIDTGNNFISGLPAFDLDGNPRILDGNSDGTDIIDMGVYEFILSINPFVDIDPDTLNLTSKGKWITAYVELPEEYNVNAIDVATVLLHLNDISLSADWGEVQDGILMLKFSRASVIDLFDGPGNYELTISGDLDGTKFEGADTIRVILGE